MNKSASKKNKKPGVTKQDLLTVSDGPYYELPALPNGFVYQVVRVEDGSYAAIVKMTK